MSNWRLRRLGFGSVLVLGGLSAVWSCNSSNSGDDSSVPSAGQSGVAGAQSFAGSQAVAGSQAIAGNTSVGAAGAPLSGTSGAGGATTSVGGSTGSAGQGQAGSPAVAGGGSGGATSGGTAGHGGTTSGGTAGHGGTTGTAGSAGAPNTGPLPLDPITGGTQGFASRFWDCCKPSCQGSKLTCSQGDSPDNGSGSSACSGGGSYMCWNFEPFQDTTNKYVSYAFAASNQGCGGCYELQFTGKAGCSDPATCPGKAASLAYNTLFIQVINSGSDVQGNQFDLLIPGGGVGKFNACSAQWGQSDLGMQYGGFFATCYAASAATAVSCTQAKCNSVFANKPDLLAGCNWFLNWFAAGDNPQITYKKVSCPTQLTSKSGISG